MKKVEMEQHHSEYTNLMRRARGAERKKSHRDAVEFAREALEHVDGMMRYAEKYEDQAFDTVDAIEIVLRYSPALLDAKSLDVVETLLKTSRRVEKRTSRSLADRLLESRRRLGQAYSMWDFLEVHPDPVLADLFSAPGIEQEKAASVVDDWVTLGLVVREAERVVLSTRLSAIVPAKCCSCGSATSAPKAMFFEHMTCPNCNTLSGFVLLSS